MKLNILKEGDVKQAQIAFYCPGCKRAHMVNINPLSGHPLWNWNGSEDKPTFTPSVLARYTHPKGYSNENPAPSDYQGEMVTDVCHTFVTDGRIQYLGDCTHELAGQTIDMVDFKWSENDDE